MGSKYYLKAFFSFSIGTWLRGIISFISTPIITYLIIPAEFGRSAMFTMLIGIATSVVFLGTDQSFVRYFYEYPEEERNNLLWMCLLPSLSIATIVSIIMLIFGSKLSILLYDKPYPYINLLFALALYLVVFQRFNQLTIRMQKKGFIFSLIEVVNASAYTVFTIIYALFISRGFYAIVFGTMMGYTAALLVGIFFETKFWKFRKIKMSDIKKVVAYGLPFVPTFLVSWLFSSIDRISLKQYSTLTEIGLYSAAFKIVSAMSLIQIGFTNFWIPVAYERYELNSEDRRFFKRANEAISLVMFSFGFLVLAFKDIIFLLLAKTYRESAYIAPFLILNPIMYTISETTVVGINFKKKTYWHLVIAAFSALFNYLGNTILVPIYGARGAAISTGFAYVIFYLLRTMISEKLYRVGFDKIKITIEVILISFVALIGTFDKTMVLNIIAGLLGFVITLTIYRKKISQFRELIVKKG
ncbi:lipopolysaccharide biosynthesis protein [Caldanaerobacter subterraneus]|uniref:Oligosaccharide flippase family protein n=1 Tax=Caldanaerobacter subterraneus TaxID=911092 RepID=A0A7Y2PN97_9THEO|nr:oligosaccharide flippase family protein [Caldanaerobacter subterraneus]NNG67958.1 oligosaccharide flippase family protein [Caldanaerobacter subterraneus]